MGKPIVAIIGRPNVGKSTFFNYIVGQRISIVEDVAGVTRDRVYADSSWRDRSFTLIDTGRNWARVWGCNFIANAWAGKFSNSNGRRNNFYYRF